VALAETVPPDERFENDITDAVALLTAEGTDPWADA
jgi:hypothetical protein